MVDKDVARQEGSMAEGREGKVEGQEGQEGKERQEGLPTRASAELKAILEALIFASPDPLTPKAMYKLLDTEPKEDVQAALAELKRDYDRPGGLQLVEVAGGYQIVTRPDLHEWVRRLFQERSTQKLTVQALYPNPKCGADFDAHIRRQSDLYTRLIRELNIKTE